MYMCIGICHVAVLCVTCTLACSRKANFYVKSSTIQILQVPSGQVKSSQVRQTLLSRIEKIKVCICHVAVLRVTCTIACSRKTNFSVKSSTIQILYSIGSVGSSQVKSSQANFIISYREN